MYGDAVSRGTGWLTSRTLSNLSDFDVDLYSEAGLGTTISILFPASTHGAPIPIAGERFSETEYPSLTDLATGRLAVLRRVPDEDAAALRYLARMNLVPGVQVEVLDRAPFNGPITVRVGEERRVLGRELSDSIRVQPLDSSDT